MADLKNYIKLCEKLNNNFKCKFYLAGGKNDTEMLEDIIQFKHRFKLCFIWKFNH